MPVAIITGATGCVGRNLVDELLSDGWRVIALHRASSNLSRLPLEIERRECNLCHPLQAQESISRGVDCLFHVAANLSHWSGDAEAQWRDNVLVTRNLIRASIAKRVRRFVFTSTGATRGHSDSGYVRTKRQAEDEIDAAVRSGLDAIILQPAIVIGAHDWNNYGQLFTREMHGIVFPGAAEFCHARDVARAHIRAYERGATGERYELGGERATWLDVFQRIARLTGNSVPAYATPAWALYVLAAGMEAFGYLTRTVPPLTVDLVRLLCKSGSASQEERAKAFRVLGYESRELDDALRDCWEWRKHVDL